MAETWRARVMAAVEADNSKRLAKLLASEHKQQLDFVHGCLSDTPLQKAAELGHQDIVSQLIHAGASVNFTNSRGRTALMIAII